MKVLVVGGSGMLGSALVSLLKDDDVELYGTFRTPWPGRGRVEIKKWFMFRAGEALPPSVQLGEGDWIVNAAGAIPQRPQDIGGDADMVRANALLPYELAEVAAGTGARMVHVTTDCVFSGNVTGRTSLNQYKERDVHDSKDFYGRTKSMGEVMGNSGVLNLRCSIVGPEPRGRSHSLLGWFLSQAGKDQAVPGFGDHLWNGVTTLALSRVIRGLILGDPPPLPSVQHLVPKGSATKAELLGMFARAFDVPTEIEVHSVGGVDRTLGTSDPKLNNRLWALAGYENQPTIEEMVEELARWVGSGGYSFRGEVSQ